jgi:hypothetical protein
MVVAVEKCGRATGRARIAVIPDFRGETLNVRKREALDQQSAPPTAGAMISVAARNFGVSTSIIRPKSPSLKARTLAHPL